jgi:hypothetical protein
MLIGVDEMRRHVFRIRQCAGRAAGREQRALLNCSQANYGSTSRGKYQKQRENSCQL